MEERQDPGHGPHEQAERSEGEGGCGHRRHRHRRRRSHSHDGHRRKERVLHTRISEQLSDDIRRLAEDLRVPVSNLVRNVLEEVFTTVEAVSGDVGDFFDEVLDEAEGVRERIERHQRARRRRERAAPSEPTDVESELREDEEAERESSRGATPSGAERFPNVIAWQPVVLNREVHCGACDRTLEAGSSAMLAAQTSAGEAPIVCPACITR